jgi:hypothetical protein
MRRALALLLLTGCYASHGRGVDAGVDAACSFTFRGAEGAPVTCRIEHADRGCDDAARCVCAARLGLPSDAMLEECVASERMPRALITFTDFCAPTVPGLDLQEALEGYFSFGTDGVTVDPACAALPARF